MKANFKFDPDLPVIDGVGHSDKIDFFNVKGGGSTNTTAFDLGYGDAHVWSSCLERTAVSTDYHSCRHDSNVTYDGSGVPFVTNPNCLNSIAVGDTNRSRGSDRVLLERVEVSGVIRRPPNNSTDDYEMLPPSPKCIVCLVLDTQSNGAAILSHPLFDSGNGDVPGGFLISGVPLPWEVEHSGGAALSYDQRRFRFLATEVIDFALNPETKYDWVDQLSTWTSAGVPPDVTSTVLTRERYSFWRDVAIGFRFDVDLGSALCQFNDAPANSGIQTCSDLSLHVFALCFDGVSTNAYVPHPFGALYISYSSRVWFRDWLSPRSIPVAPGADGDVVPDDEVPLAILADQSAVMAGDGTFLDAPHKRRHTKASTGHFNFRPKGDPVLANFDDDPEFSFARRGLRKYESRSRAPDIVQRRFKANKYDDNEDYHAREGDRGGKRGKY